MGCLDEKKLSSYLDQTLSIDERNEIEEHISCCNNCLDLLLVAYEAQKWHRRLFSRLLRFARNDVIARSKATKQSQKNKRSELKWLIAALFLFALSFLFKKYFLQFLVAATVLGFKWVMEGEAGRRAIMIFKGIQKPEDQQKKFERKSPPRMSV